MAIKTLGKIIGIIGCIFILVSFVSPWLINLEDKPFNGLYFFGSNKVFTSLLIITIILSLIAIILSLMEKKTAGILLLIIGVLLTGWGVVLKFAIRSFGISYIWEKYGAEWMGETVSTFFNIGWGIYILIIGGVLIFAGGILKLKSEFLTNVLLRIKDKIKKIDRKNKIIILVVILIIAIFPIGKNWFKKHQQEQFLNYREEAIKKQDPTICEKMKPEGAGDYCYKDVGVLKEDLSICDKIQSHVIKDSCYTDIAAKQKNPDICEKLSDRGSKSFCYYSVAATKHDPTLCENSYFNLISREDCYHNVAREMQDLTLCDRITNQSTKTFCYADIAIIKKDANICEQDGIDKTFCYRQVAEAINDPALCEKEKTQPFRDFCFEEIAEDLKSLEICDRIEDQSTKEICYRKVKEK